VKETVNKFGQCLPKHKRQGLHSEKPDEKALEKLNLKPAKTTSGAGEAQAPQPSGGGARAACSGENENRGTPMEEDDADKKRNGDGRVIVIFML
jgi:hypothetical protein